MADEKYLRTGQRRIPAPAQAIFALLADPNRHPELDCSGTVLRVKASDVPLRLGATFEMAMKRGAKYVMRNTVVAFEPDRVIAWQPRPTIGLVGLVIGGRIWRYDLTPDGDGTVVKETWDLRQERLPFVVIRDAPTAARNMGATLERIEQIVTGRFTGQ